MKRRKNLLPLFMAAALFTACNSDDSNGTRDNNDVQFLGTFGEIASRVTGEDWNTGDEIGVYMVKDGEALSTNQILNNANNVKYSTVSGNGVFTASPGIQAPDEDVNFIAYYPYDNAQIQADFTYPVSTSNLKDILYAKTPKVNINTTKSAVGLVFSHMMAKLIFKVKAGGVNITDLTGLKVSINGMYTDARFNLASGNFESESGEASLNFNVTPGDPVYIAEVMVIPCMLNGNKVTFELDNGKIFEWPVTAAKFESARKYTYTATLDYSVDDPIVYIANPQGTITAWIEGVAENEKDIKPGIQAPVSPEVIFTESFGTGTLESSNILIADAKSIFDTYNNPEISFAGTVSQIRANSFDGGASDNRAIWLDPGKTPAGTFTITVPSGLTNMTFSFDTAPSSNTGYTPSIHDMTLEASNGQQASPVVLPEVSVSKSNYSHLEVELPDGTTLITFTTTGAMIKSWYLDNLRLTAVRP